MPKSSWVPVIAWISNHRTPQRLDHSIHLTFLIIEIYHRDNDFENNLSDFADISEVFDGSKIGLRSVCYIRVRNNVLWNIWSKLSLKSEYFSVSEFRTVSRTDMKFILWPVWLQTNLKKQFLRQSMYLDESFAEYTKNDGMISHMHCQE